MEKISNIQAANFLRDEPQVSSCTRLVDRCCKSPVGFLPELLILSPSQFKEGEKAETSIVSLSRTTASSFFLSFLLRPHPPGAKGGGCSWIQITTWWERLCASMGARSNFTVSVWVCDESSPALPLRLGLIAPPCSTVALDSDVTMKMAVTQGTGTQTLLICSSNALGGNRKPQEGHKQQLCIDWHRHLLHSGKHDSSGLAIREERRP